MPSDEMSEEDWTDYYLLWVKFDSFMWQNGLFDRDIESLLRELLGQDPITPGGETGYD